MAHRSAVTALRARKRLASGLLLLFLLSGCSPITSTQIDPLETKQPPVQGITYLLPKSMLRATVTGANGKAQNITVEKFDTTDGDLQFVANTHLSGLSDDIIIVETYPSGLLKAVTTDVRDQTAAVVEKLAKLIFSSVSGVPSSDLRNLPGGTGIPATTLLAVEFDPFVPRQLIETNKKLAGFGYCIIVAGEHTQLPQDVCEKVVESDAGSEIDAPYRTFTARNSRGLYYRRPIYERVHIFRKEGTRYSEVWSSVETFANRSALLEIRLNRRAFIKMKTVLTFDNGVLTRVEIDKPSEVLAALSLPITILDAVWKFPTLRIQRLENDNGLRERELAARKKEAELREREIALREQDQTSPNRTTFVIQGSEPRAITPDERQLLLDRCADSFGTERQCKEEIELRAP